MRLRLVLALGLALGAMGWTERANAQDTPGVEGPKPGSIALDQFDPAPLGDAFFGIPSPYAHGRVFEPRVGFIFEGAEQPLKLQDDQNAGAGVGRPSAGGGG